MKNTALTPTIKDQLEQLVAHIQGEVIYQECRDSRGRSHRRIMIAYDKEEDS